jgi:NADPH:quinone reductase-like Zn-dependent oxidoreductase
MKWRRPGANKRSDGKMKAVICPKYGGPEVLQLTEVEKPVPGENEVLIRIHATTVTVADTRVRGFNVPRSYWVPARIMLGITKPKRPILGIELAGEIEAVGGNVTLFKKGDQVFAATELTEFGAYAEYICLPEDGQIAIIPANISYAEAAAIPIGACAALHYIRKGGVGSGTKVLIYGASGSVGTYAVQLARYFGAEITGVCSGVNLDLVKSLGADNVIDYTAADFPERLEMYDVILLAIDKCPFSICNRALKESGVYLNVTIPVKSFQMLWTSMTSSKKIFVGEEPPEKVKDLQFLKKLVEEGVVKPVIDRKYPFGQIAEAHRYVDKGHKRGNVVVTIR